MDASLEQPWIAQGDHTRCRTHDVVFLREESCPAPDGRSCYGAPPTVDEESDASIAVDAHEAAFAAAAVAWGRESEQLLARAAFDPEIGRETALRAHAYDADRAARANRIEAMKLAKERLRRQGVNVLRRELKARSAH